MTTCATAVGQNCQVCGLHAHGIHFGVISCRACAAFFRRTVALEMEYVCRDGRNQCRIEPGARCLCRACRYEKCKRLGMNPDGVQLFRDFLGSKGGRRKKPTKAGEMEEEDGSSMEGQRETVVCFQQPQETSGENLELASKQWLIIDKVDEIFSTDSAAPSYNVPGISDAYQMLFAYKRFVEKRTSLYQEKGMEEIIRRPRGSRLNSAFEMFREQSSIGRFAIDVPLHADFLMQMPAFKELEKPQKWAVFKNFWLRFMLLERLYRNFPAYQKEFEAIMKKGKTSCQEDPNEALRYHQLVVPFVQLQPNDLEFVAMVANTLWSLEGRPGVTRDTLHTAIQQRSRIFNEMHEHYVKENQSLSPPNYALRLVGMCDLVHNIDKVVKQRKEDLEVLRVFDAIHISKKAVDLLGLADEEVETQETIPVM